MDSKSDGCVSVDRGLLMKDESVSDLDVSPEDSENGNIDRRILAARAGSSETLGQLFDACRGYLLLVANAELDPRLRAKGGASDLVQETFLEAQQSISQFRGHNQAELLAWLRQILLSHLANFSRRYRQTSKRRISCEVPLESIATGKRSNDFPVKSRELSPSWCAVTREETEIAERSIEKLDELDRTIILLVHRDHLSFVDAGRIMKLSADAARRLWSRAIERLAREVETAHELG